MVVMADLLDDPEDDKGKAKKLADLLAKTKRLWSNPLEKELALFRKMQSTIFPDATIRSAALGSSAYAMGLSQEIEQINRSMAGIPSSLSVSLRLESELSQLNRAAALAAQTAAHNYVPEIYKSFLDSQFSVQSQLETCKRALESAAPNWLINQDILAKHMRAFQESAYTAGIGKGFFRESYANAIQTISASVFSTQGLMLESVRRVLENQHLAFDTAARLAIQGISKDLLANTKAVFDYRHITFDADFLQKAIAPFVRQWAWLVCDVRLVSVDIDHDKSHLLYAEYDRDTVIELLTARFALDATETDISISSSGNLEQPNDLFECSGEHEGHHAHYDGETILTSKDNDNTNKALSQCLDELRKDGVFGEDEWDQIETDARRAEMFVRENFANMMHIGLSYLMELSVLCVKENPISAEEFRARQEKALSRLRNLLPKPDEGRPKGTGLFKDKDDFLIALKDVLGKSKKEPSEREALHALRQHPLCQRQTKEFPTPNHTKTLRNWLKKCGMTYKEALERYWKPTQKGK